MVGSGAEVWPKMLRAEMTLKLHESVCAVLTPDLLVFFDMMEVEKVPAWFLNEPGISYMTGEESVPEPTMITNFEVNSASVSMLIHCLTAVQA